MRPLLALLLIGLEASAALAQLPTAPPDSAWGGYPIAAEVPYQPTLTGQPVEALPAGANPNWQPYPPPAVDPSGQAVMLDAAPPGAAPAIVPPNPIDPATGEPSLRQSLTPADARNGFFQKAKFTATWLPQLDSQALGWTDLRTEVVTALPFFTRENPIIITPSYELHFLDRPANLDLPPRLNDVAIDFHVFRVYENHWIADVAVTPGLFADDHSFGSSEALRINGRAVGVYAPTIDLKYALGVTYVDGGWSKVVPIAGVIYTPNDDVEYDLVFPTPKVAWRLTNFSPVPGRDDRWLYVAVEYGNSAWAFQQSNGTPDVLDYRDYRLILGLERKIVGGFSNRFEIGYVFNRDIKVASISGNDISMNNTLLLRAGISY